MTLTHAYEARPLLVPCTTDAAHAFSRPDTCPTCAGRGTRPADAVEYVYCDESNHELELRTDEAVPTLEGVEPDHADDGSGAVWDCPYRGCGGTVIITRAGA